jgi:cytochrome c
MIHKGIKDSKARRSLIEILKIAMGPEGAKKVVAQKLLNPEIVDGQIKNLKNLSKSSIVTKIVHCHDVLSVSTADGKTFPYWEMNVSLKFDGSSRGPSTGVPVIIDSGSMGDRKTIIFSSANELKKMMISSCDD